MRFRAEAYCGGCSWYDDRSQLDRVRRSLTICSSGLLEKDDLGFDGITNQRCPESAPPEIGGCAEGKNKAVGDFGVHFFLVLC